MNDDAKMTRRKEKGKWSFLLLVLLGFLVCSSVYSQSVVIYEQTNFGGSSKTLGIGDHKLLAPLNDNVFSIRVPTGLVAVIFDKADDVGGFGVWVDLLEDHADLMQLGLHDKASFIRVFATPNSRGYVWARNSMKKGQFVGGHWERLRAAGSPANSTAVVAPPLAKAAPTTPGGVTIHDHRKTVVEVRDAQSVITNLANQAPDEALLWDRASADQMGVLGSDYRGRQEIGSAAIQRAGKLGIGPIDILPDNINMWFPQKRKKAERPAYYKHTLVGTLLKSPEQYDNEDVYPDHDINIYIPPDPAYMYMITEGHKPERGRAQSTKEVFTENADCSKPFTHVEAEIDSTNEAKDLLLVLARKRLGKQLAAYGPWIFDNGHCHQPEIHPAEQIWWSENVGINKTYNLNLYSDDSERFWWREQMDDGTKLRPWAAPPLKGVFAIAFEAEIGNRASKFEVKDLSANNVIAFPNANKEYSLVYQNRSLVTFVPNSGGFKVSFEKIGLKPGTSNIVRGFLVLETSVGTVTQIKHGLIFPDVGSISGGGSFTLPLGADPDKVPQSIERLAFKKVAGHYMFSISLIVDPTKRVDTIPDVQTIKPVVPCERERSELIRLNQLLESEEASLRQLNSDLAKASAAAKLGIRRDIVEKKADIARLRGLIGQAKKNLEKCKVENSL